MCVCLFGFLIPKCYEFVCAKIHIFFGREKQILIHEDLWLIQKQEMNKKCTKNVFFSDGWEFWAMQIMAIALSDAKFNYFLIAKPSLKIKSYQIIYWFNSTHKNFDSFS